MLGRNGYRVTLAATASEARGHLRSLAFDLMILDVMMPGETGVDFAADVRRTSEVPILMLTALDAADDRVRGLEAGADDYLAKPYEPRELLLRIASILRRAAPRAPKGEGVARFGPFAFHPERGELRQGDEPIRITERERDMLSLLSSAGGATVSREDLAGLAAAEGGNERAVDVQVNRLRRKIESGPRQPRLPPDRERARLSPPPRSVTCRSPSSRTGIAGPAPAAREPCPRGRAPVTAHVPNDRRRRWGFRVMRAIADALPKRLYSRALLILIVPMLLLQCVMSYFFLERHWQSVTFRLSQALGAGHRRDDRPVPRAARRAMARKRWSASRRTGSGSTSTSCRPSPCPRRLPKPFLQLLDRSLSGEIRKQIGLPYWIDTVGRSNFIEIRIQLDTAVLRVIARRSAAYASNSYIFILWMVRHLGGADRRGDGLPAQPDPADPAARRRGREPRQGAASSSTAPNGATEVRRAGYAFLEMRRRIERAVEQRTTMLNGVSHDLRTVLTRFKLSLELFDDGPDADAMHRDIDEMGRMLEAYLAFARGDAGEIPVMTDMAGLLEELRSDAERHGHVTGIAVTGETGVIVRPDSFKRCLANLVGNAGRHGKRIEIVARRDDRFFTVHVDDDGPGIPADKREDVFRPFFRLDAARNQDQGGTGLGLAIARDIARSHGGDIQLGESPMGGLRATVRVPV